MGYLGCLLVTDRFRYDEPQRDSGTSAGRQTQLGGALPRHIDVATDDGLIDDGLLEGDREPSSGDNLVAGDGPGEDGGDQRVQPAMGLPERSDEGASGAPRSGQAVTSDRPGAA